ncbi:MAG: response regulator [Alphaproteobacteria bacterium]|nr:MAG: response regulator [Alphaproteobacteria bacterium]
MRIYDNDSEKHLIEMIDHLRDAPSTWRALHFHFSALQPENRQIRQLQSAINILQGALGQYQGGAYLCRDSDFIVIYEHKPGASLDTMMLDMRFLFADDPLASAGYVSGQPDGFFTAYDLSIGFEQFFYLCLHKLSLTNHVMPSMAGMVENKAVPNDFVMPDLRSFRKTASERAERKQIKILVVEDSYFSRQMIRQALSAQHEMLLAKDGKEGLFQYLTYAPDITFLDIGLPHLSGHDILRRISEADEQAFVVMLTASNHSSDINHAIALGAKGYIVKPFTVGKLQAYIDLYLDKVKNNRGSGTS